MLPIDKSMMERALILANQARVIAPPNPWVGCVIVNQNQIIGEGFTQTPGNAHAEIMALQQAKGHAKGATVYVTLEPCAHFGRTPPCVNALIEAGISRVVIGIQDPDEHVQGKGIDALKQAGIEVCVGLLSKEIALSLAPYLHHRNTGLPYCVLKGAISLDGRVAAQDGTSQWITSPEARLDSQQIRSESQAILVGSGTASVDRPSLTVREIKQFPFTPPLRVVLDSQGKTTSNGPLFDTSLAPTLIFTSSSCPEKTINEWKSHGVEVEIAPKAESGTGVDLKYVLTVLGKRGILQVMVEGGGKILGAFLDAKLANHLTLFVGGCVLGNRGTPLFDVGSITTLKEAPQFKLLKTQVLGNTVRLDYHL